MRCAARALLQSWIHHANPHRIPATTFCILLSVVPLAPHQAKQPEQLYTAYHQLNSNEPDDDPLNAHTARAAQQVQHTTSAQQFVMCACTCLVAGYCDGLQSGFFNSKPA